MCVCVCVGGGGGGGGGGKSCASRFFSTKTLKGGLICSELGREKNEKKKRKKEGQQTKQGKELCGVMQAIVLPWLLLSLESVRGFSLLFRKTFLVCNPDQFAWFPVPAFPQAQLVTKGTVQESNLHNRHSFFFFFYHSKRRWLDLILKAKHFW